MGDSFTPTHLIFVSIMALLIFGPRRIPMIGRGVTRGIREFKTTVIGVEGEGESEKNQSSGSE